MCMCGWVVGFKGKKHWCPSNGKHAGLLGLGSQKTSLFFEGYLNIVRFCYNRFVLIAFTGRYETF